MPFLLSGSKQAIELDKIKITPIPPRNGLLIMFAATAEVAEIDTASQAQQQWKQDKNKTPLRLVEAVHLPQDRIDFFFMRAWARVVILSETPLSDHQAFFKNVQTIDR
ncbi:hypothetical protein QC823_07545 [Halomonas vilamensis]|uniref:Uncharacterized protein n=1 Tax=Vreelandella vilamensis TaxID=531309 RepID=A0ABU1H404_9GAMM|nr:hypothetical protein [Halomonas vilamensis]MDR5898840.1 hypothetical protein [Halomonas vilamensis]